MFKVKKHRNFISILVVMAFVVGLVLYMYSQIKQLVYQERKELLEQLVDTSAAAFNENINSQWRVINIFNNAIEAELNEDSDVEVFLKQFVQNDSDKYFLVDKQGKYYCSDGVSGKIIDTDYYNDQEQLEYVGSLPHIKTNTNYLVFRQKLNEPIICSYKDNEVEMVYCGSLHSLNELTDRVSKLFEGNNNTIIFDKNTGIMLYKQLNLGLLIDGYNIYDKYLSTTIMYDEVATDTINQIKEDNSTVTLINTGSNKAYICSSPLDVSNWTLLIVVDNDFFNEETGTTIVSIVTTIGVIVTMLGALIIAVTIFRLKAKQEKQVSAALESAYKTKSDFLSYMSHDIRTPINGIIGMSNIGKNIKGNSEKTNECFNKIDTASKHLLSLVNDVLDMSAIESGKVIIKQERFSLNNLLNSCLDIIKGQLANRELEITSDLELPYENLIGDELHLKQVLINILGNALKFTNDGGKIHLACKCLEVNNNIVRYAISVSDTGIGISKELQEHLFDAFVQGDNNRSQYKGTGLGMAISNQYVKMMNGTLSVESKENVGSTFTIEIPFEIDNSQNNEDITNLKILLVEDNELNIEIARELLKEKGAIIEVARNGKEAIEMFKKNQYDLILMDIMMPVMTGIEASKEIRKTDKNIPIIALSANTFKDDVEAFKKAGMNGYASKPLNIDSLIKTICEVRK